MCKCHVNVIRRYRPDSKYQVNFIRAQLFLLLYRLMTERSDL